MFDQQIHQKVGHRFGVEQQPRVLAAGLQHVTGALDEVAVQCGCGLWRFWQGSADRFLKATVVGLEQLLHARGVLLSQQDIELFEGPFQGLARGVALSAKLSSARLCLECQCAPPLQGLHDLAELTDHAQAALCASCGLDVLKALVEQPDAQQEQRHEQHGGHQGHLLRDAEQAHQAQAGFAECNHG